MTVNDIKQSFKSYMDGVAASSMRAKGLHYRVIWGISIMHLKEIAEEVKSQSSNASLCNLAQQLWKEDCRECKILATLLMPSDAMTEQIVQEWLETLPTQEMSEWLAFNLLRHLPNAKELAQKAINSNNKLQQNCGQNILKRIG
ncbi:MAG: DNA alkylation repair protein [Prevotellaceae bacterium]|nr:DNA alkylation repair protein [Prevotellaceae bacterium]